MNILYYSNYCKHSQRIIQYISKNSLSDKLHCICIDRRTKDPKTNQMIIMLENNKRVIMPPNVHSVPALLVVKQNYNAIFGDDIIQFLTPHVTNANNNATRLNGEPFGYSLGMGSAFASNIMSEQYTFYDLTPDELSAKGNGNRRPIYNYVSANHNSNTIETPPDNYQPDKVGDVQMDKLQAKRNDEIVQHAPGFI